MEVAVVLERMDMRLFLFLIKYIYSFVCSEIIKIIFLSICKLICIYSVTYNNY